MTLVLVGVGFVVIMAALVLTIVLSLKARGQTLKEAMELDTAKGEHAAEAGELSAKAGQADVQNALIEEGREPWPPR